MTSHRITVPQRRLQSLFGNCYPTLKSPNKYVRRKFLSSLVENEVHVHVKIEFKDESEENGPLVFEVQGHLIHDTIDAYNVALNLERWLKNIPELSTFEPPRWWTNFFWSTPKSDIFCIDEIDPLRLVKWIRAQGLKAKDFQIFTKFGSDTSIAFRNQAQATMFKMSFVENI